MYRAKRTPFTRAASIVHWVRFPIGDGGRCPTVSNPVDPMDDRGIAGESAWSAILFEDGPVVYPANAFESRLRVGSSRKKSQKKKTSGWWPFAFIYLFLFHSLLRLTSFLSQNINERRSFEKKHRSLSTVPLLVTKCQRQRIASSQASGTTPKNVLFIPSPVRVRRPCRGQEK